MRKGAEKGSGLRRPEGLFAAGADITATAAVLADVAGSDSPLGPGGLY